MQLEYTKKIGFEAKDAEKDKLAKDVKKPAPVFPGRDRHGKSRVVPAKYAGAFLIEIWLNNGIRIIPSFSKRNTVLFFPVPIILYYAV